MSLLNDDRGSRRAWRILVVLAGVLVFAISLGGGILLSRAGDSDPASAASDDPSADQSSRRPAADGRVLTVPGPKDDPDGIPSGYGHTRDGAVSAAASLLQARDIYAPPDRLKNYVDAACTRESRDRALRSLERTSAKKRAALGLTKTGPMTDDTYRWFLPKGVKIAKSAADRVELWVLGIDSRSSLGDAGPTDTPVVEEAVMIWERGDWRISDDRPPLRPSPVKPTARRMSEAGWLRLAFTPTD